LIADLPRSQIGDQRLPSVFASIKQRYIGDEATFTFGLRELHLNALAIDIDVLGDDGNDFVFDDLDQPWRNLAAIVHQHELQTLLGCFSTGWWLRSAAQAIE
jgi:hypothetical protein